MKASLLFLVSITVAVVAAQCEMKNYMGYYGSWATYRTQYGLKAQDIDPTPYTHLIYSFAGISSDYKLIPLNNEEIGFYEQFNTVKVKKPSIKTLIAVGGWSFNDPGPTQTLFSETVSTPQNRSTFIKSTIEFLRLYKFDGLDVDWEYPVLANRGGKPEDKDNLSSLLRELRDAFDATPEKFLLGIATPLSSYSLAGYDLPAVAAAVDYINVMSYDLHGTWDNPKTINTHTNLVEMKALYESLYLISTIPSEKLNFGIAVYGKSFKLSDPACTTPKSTCLFTEGGEAGAGSQAAGTLMYSEIVDLVNETDITIFEGSAYASYGTDSWVGFDTAETLKLKYDYAKEKCFGGMMVWAIDQDSAKAPMLSSITIAPAPAQGESYPNCRRRMRG